MSWERHVLLALVGGALGYGGAALERWWNSEEEAEEFTFALNPDVGEVDHEELAMIIMWCATAEEGDIGVG